MRVLAAEMRNERLMRIEERAARLPVVLSIPLALFIFPCLMVVIGTPVGGSGCLILVVNTLTLSGDSQLNSTGCSAAGVSPPTPKTVTIAE